MAGELVTDLSSERIGRGAATVIVAGRRAQPTTIMATANGTIIQRMLWQCCVMVL